jgi:outer membrane lipoprotein-sorting protein
MKKFLFSLVAIAAFGFTYAQTADEIVTKHIAAIGGADAWKKVNSVITTGSVKINGAEVGVVQTVLHLKGYRQDISAFGMNGYQVVTPKEGWNFMPFQGQKAAEPITADDLKESQDDLDAQGTLLDYQTKGHTIEYLGTEDIEGVEALKLKQTLKGGRAVTFFFDPKTYYIMRTVTKQKANGKEVDVKTNFSNYQKLPEGIVTPLSIGLPFGEMTISKVEINKPIDENIFKPAK